MKTLKNSIVTDRSITRHVDVQIVVYSFLAERRDFRVPLFPPSSLMLGREEDFFFWDAAPDLVLLVFLEPLVLERGLLDRLPFAASFFLFRPRTLAAPLVSSFTGANSGVGNTISEIDTLSLPEDEES